VAQELRDLTGALCSAAHEWRRLRLGPRLGSACQPRTERLRAKTEDLKTEGKIRAGGRRARELGSSRSGDSATKIGKQNQKVDSGKERPNDNEENQLSGWHEIKMQLRTESFMGTHASGRGLDTG
jgi:hypothetical protein